MHLNTILSCALAATVVSAGKPKPGNGNSAPSLSVPACPKKGIAVFNQTVPDKAPFPETHVELCYDQTNLHLTFKAFEEETYHFDPKQTTNGDIWEYEVMEAFIYQGVKDPQTYLEFEVNPNNVTYQAFIYNPTKVRAEGAPFDHMFVTDPITDGLVSSTTLDREAKTWFSDVTIPLALFNVEKPCGTQWRMNFFRTLTSPDTFPEQGLGGWGVPNKASFHITEFFGHVRFV
ncbi:hypothetical protein FQN53_003129 [Emmonsiellopsis sp. PD_33]|nr:hypothetical protein FQN53_003129 [Emmonsiellopsis sp. PD_33]KAK2797910.1 hypothetical protein FQN51_008218 [Onygenales sp. PD_10]